MIESRDIRPYLWVELVNYASYIQNRVPQNSIVRVTPFEALMGNNFRCLTFEGFLLQGMGPDPT